MLAESAPIQNLPAVRADVSAPEGVERMQMDAITGAVSALAASVADQLWVTATVLLKGWQPAICLPVGPNVKSDDKGDEA